MTTGFRLPLQVKTALIEVCGRAFWFKQNLYEYFSGAGVPDEVFMQYDNEAKFQITRAVLRDLESMGEAGAIMQRRLLTSLCKLRDLPDSNVPDRNAGLDALRKLQFAAKSHDLFVKEEKKQSKQRDENAGNAARENAERSKEMQKLKEAFFELTQCDNKQARGYALEPLLKDLFTLNGIAYRNSYVGDGEQIDGFFHFGGFDYVVEARWRKESPNLAALSAIRDKVSRKVDSTRGLVVSIPSFRPEVLRRLREVGPAKLLFLDGYDLTLILEERISLSAALQAKVDKAAQEGILHYSLGDHLAP